MDLNTLDQIREQLRALLADFRDRPFFDLREADPQARLFNGLRERLEPADVALTIRAHSRNSHSFPPALRTSRVHRELKLDGDLKIDIAVLRGEVELTVHQNGPLDIIAPVRGRDLAAVIEVKAAPSRNMWGAFRDDLAKLSSITNAYPNCFGFFVAFDKSLHLGGTASNVKPCLRWLDSLAEDATGLVEAHWLDTLGQPRSRRGRVDL